MTDNTPPAVIDNDTGFLLDENTEEQLANQAAEDLFDNEENTQKTSGVIASFVDSYSRNKNTVPIEIWLDQEFEKYPSIWANDSERKETTLNVIESIQKNNEAKEDLYAHLDKGKSRESWLAKKIEQGASSVGVTDIGNYAQKIDMALKDANLEMMDKIFNNSLSDEQDLEDLVVSGSLQLHGFIAEADLANQFNINAAASGSKLKAEVPSVTTLNSPDIVIKDAVGNVLEHVQVKLYEPNERGLSNLKRDIKSHDYSDTALVVNKEHVAALRKEFPDLKIDSRYEQGGVKMELDDYANYKKLQKNAQLREETKQYQWNDANRMSIAKEIGKKALISAAFNAGFQGARILGRRVWNSLTGKENHSANEDLQEFFKSSVKSAKNAGVQVAVSGALVVAAKSGWIKVLKKTPAGKIADIAYIGLENAKCLYKLAKGEMSGVETLDAMGNTNCVAIGGLAGAAQGAVLGAEIGAALTLNPAGAAIGGFIGAVVGGIAGSTVGEAVYEGGKAIVKTAAKVIESAYEGTKAVAKSVFNTLTFGLFA